MIRRISSSFVAIGLMIGACGLVRADSLKQICLRWNAACGGSVACSQFSNVDGAYGLAAEVRTEYSGCATGVAEAVVKVTNTNSNVWFKVDWYGKYAGDNLFFSNPPVAGSCPGSTCTCVPIGATCPPSGCEFLNCAVIDSCSCEIADTSNRQVGPLTTEQSGCVLPTCSGGCGNACDNAQADCPPNDTDDAFCPCLDRNNGHKPGAHVFAVGVRFDSGSSCHVSPLESGPVELSLSITSRCKPANCAWNGLPLP